jgi:hypothetical protein
MKNVVNFPSLVFVLSMIVLWFSARIGAAVRKRRRSLDDDEFADLGTIVAATLTLLGLIIGFSFSMAITRYDQRKTLEEGEANAIGTEYVRADLLLSADAAKVRTLLRNYLDQRILFYKARRDGQLEPINQRTSQLEADLWSAVQAPATAQPTPVAALVVAGMNDVLNSQGYTQAAWWNRIPTAAWLLLAAMAVCSNLLIGYGCHTHTKGSLLLILPLLVSISFFSIADMDSPRGGIIRVRPQNLESLAESLEAH